MSSNDDSSWVGLVIVLGLGAALIYAIFRAIAWLIETGYIFILLAIALIVVISVIVIKKKKKANKTTAAARPKATVSSPAPKATTATAASDPKKTIYGGTYVSTETSRRNAEENASIILKLFETLEDNEVVESIKGSNGDVEVEM